MSSRTDTDPSPRAEPCLRLDCPFESALQRLRLEDDRRIRCEQSIVENLDRLSDSFFRLQREHQDREHDLLELRRVVDANAKDVLQLRSELEQLHELQLHVARRVGSVKYWLAAIIAAMTIAAPLLQQLLRPK